MEKLKASAIRNIALIGHGGEGKTTLAEAMLFNAGSSDRRGRVDEGTSIMDFDPEEINRKISISLAVAYGVFHNVKFNIIDVPGLFDFEGEFISAMRVADAAIIVTSACGQLTVGTEKALDYCIKHSKPCMIFINQIDKENSDYLATVNCLNDKYPNKIAGLQVPILEEHKMVGYVNILDNVAFKFTQEGPVAEPTIPSSCIVECNEIRNSLIERVAETDDTLMEKFFSGEELTKEEIVKGVKIAINSGSAIPVLAGSALSNKGIINLMIEIIDCMPAPIESPDTIAFDKSGAEIAISCDASASFAAQVFKTIADPFVGKLSLFKVLRGTLKSGEIIYNSISEKAEKTGSLYILKGKKQEPVEELIAGDIGALAKLLYTNTGDTLCDQQNPIKFKNIEFPYPVISLAVSAAKQGEDEKVISGLNRLLEEDNTFALEKNIETNEMLLSGLGETQLDIVVKKLKHKFNVEAKLSDPRIPYRETIKKIVHAQGKHKKQSGGHGQYGDCWIRFEPLATGDFEFCEEVVGGSVPKQYIPAVEKGLREVIGKGVLAGYPMVHLKAVLYDGSYHDVDSSEMAFKIAASVAYKEGCAKASPVLLEPIMKAEIFVPEQYMGDILGDLNKRRGRILGMETRDGKQLVSTEVPHSEMFKYATDLRSMTHGRGSFSMKFDRYEELPQSLSQKIVDEFNKSKIAE